MNKGLYGIPKNRTYEAPLSASYATNSTSASYALTASYALNGGGSGGDFVPSAWTGSSTSQFSGTASFATTASFVRTAQTASYVLNAVSASFATSASRATIAITSSYPINVTGSNLYSTAPASAIPNNSNNSIFLGSGAGNSSRANNSNFLGENAGASAISASFSNFLGRAGNSATKASQSNFLGFDAGAGATNADNSNFLGSSAGNSAENASNSNFIGNGAGNNAVSASFSTLLGYQVGSDPTLTRSIGSNNIIIGTNITLPRTASNAINIGGILFGSGSYSTIAGASFSGSANGRIGINQPSPNFTLDVSGSGNYTNGLTVTGSLIAASFTGLAGSLTGSLVGTASWATNAITSSHPIAVTGSTLYSTNPNTIVTGTALNNSIFLGGSAGRGATNASQSNFIGSSSGQNATNANNSNFIGYLTGLDATNAYQSNFIGSAYVGAGATNASFSNFIGTSDTGRGATGANNSNFIGRTAGFNAINAIHSNFIGFQTGYIQATASYSNFIGYQAGFSPDSTLNLGTNNIIIGTNITLAARRRDSINIGAIIFGTGSNSSTTLNTPFSGSAMGRIGINQPLPIYSLDVSGSGNYTNNLTVTGSFTVVTGSSVELQVLNTGVKIGGAPSDIHTVTGSLNITGSVAITSGSVTMPNRPAFRVYGSGSINNLSTTQNGDGTLNSNNFTVDWQQGTAFTASSGIFTAPIAGLYDVHMICRNDGNANFSQLAVLKNNSNAAGNVIAMVEFAGNSTMNHAGASSIARLAVGDTLRLKVLANTITFDGNDSWAVAYIG